MRLSIITAILVLTPIAVLARPIDASKPQSVVQACTTDLHSENGCNY